MQNSSTGIEVLVGVGVKPSSPDRWPSWKIHTIAPSVAPRVSALPSNARIGCTTLPVNRNSSTSVVTMMISAGEPEVRADRVFAVDERRRCRRRPATCDPGGAGMARTCLPDAGGARGAVEAGAEADACRCPPALEVLTADDAGEAQLSLADVRHGCRLPVGGGVSNTSITLGLVAKSLRSASPTWWLARSSEAPDRPGCRR